MTDGIRVAIVEDQRQTREGLALLIGNTPGFRTTGQWPSMEEALEDIARGLPDVLLADIHLPGIRASTACASSRRAGRRW